MPAQRDLYGLFGDPVAHSLSPALHAAAFSRLAPASAYLPFRVPAGRLAEAVAAARVLGVRGLNVTTPHKDAIATLIDGLEGDAASTGAVNVVVRRGERLVGCNTDTVAVRTALADRGANLRGLPALVFGAGGAAKAAAHALATLGAEVRIANRSTARARALAESIRRAGGRAQVVEGDLAAHLRACGVVVQATSVGFLDADASPISDEATLAPGAFALELVYRPLETRFLSQARRSGAVVVDGLELLVRQAVASLALWLDRDVPMDVWLPRLRAAALESP
jgi:shikimate dehydrogenase